ncbi:hypothetical protein [Streptomyces sp. cg36]|uniref:hypothetical protein n=1 Tax=Streptomyces sp. cg36 TaxID=3238798 RepID=UPI0034E20A8E
MQSNTAALFTSGPLAHLLDLALRVQSSGGALSLDDEVRRYVRVTGTPGAGGAECPARAGAALLDLVGDLLADGAPVTVPGEFRQKLARAAEGTGEAEYLHTLAGIVRVLDGGPPAEYDELPMNGWEAGEVFPHLCGFTVHLTDDLESATFADAVRSHLAAEHPFCGQSVAPLAAEAQRALVLFPDGSSQRENLLPTIPWVSPDALRELLRTVDEHLLGEHA